MNDPTDPSWTGDENVGAPQQREKYGSRKSSLKTMKSKKFATNVSFRDSVTVHTMPSEEAEEAEETRKGSWMAAPDHDELWDGNNREFWDQEKSMEDVRRIVVVRQMRMYLQYNLGYSFFAMVANFKKRKPIAIFEEDDDESKSVASGSSRRKSAVSSDGEVIPEFETSEAEETAIRKEIRELFTESVKGLDFPDLIQDREAFDKIYLSTILTAVEARSHPGMGLLRIESLVDEIMNVEEVCELIGVQWVAEARAIPMKEVVAVQEQIENAVNKEEKRREGRRASIEVPQAVPPAVFAERRASMEARKRASIEGAYFPAAALIPMQRVNDDEDDDPIFASSNRVQVVAPPVVIAQVSVMHVFVKEKSTAPTLVVAVDAPVPTSSSSTARRYPVICSLFIAFLFALLSNLAMSFVCEGKKDASSRRGSGVVAPPHKHGSGPLVVFLPLLSVLGLTLMMQSAQQSGTGSFPGLNT